MVQKNGGNISNKNASALVMPNFVHYIGDNAGDVMMSYAKLSFGGT